MPLCDQLKQLMRLLLTLQASLQQLADSLANAQLSAVDTTSVDSIAAECTALLSRFLGILEALENTDITPAIEQQIRPYTTEAHRRLRLIKTEAMRLRTARQKPMVEKSQSRLSAHLIALQQFAEAIANAVCKPASSSTLQTTSPTADNPV